MRKNKPTQVDIDFVKERLNTTEDKAIKLIEGGFNVNVLRNGYDLLGNSINSINKKNGNVVTDITESIKTSISELNDQVKNQKNRNPSEG
jgi:hypothetical protein